MFDRLSHAITASEQGNPVPALRRNPSYVDAIERDNATANLQGAMGIAAENLRATAEQLDLPGIAQEFEKSVQLRFPGERVHFGSHLWAPHATATASWEAATNGRPLPTEAAAVLIGHIGLDGFYAGRHDAAMVLFQRNTAGRPLDTRLAVVSALTPLVRTQKSFEYSPMYGRHIGDVPRLFDLLVDDREGMAGLLLHGVERARRALDGDPALRAAELRRLSLLRAYIFNPKRSLVPNFCAWLADPDARSVRFSHSMGGVDGDDNLDTLIQHTEEAVESNRSGLGSIEPRLEEQTSPPLFRTKHNHLVQELLRVPNSLQSSSNVGRFRHKEGTPNRYAIGEESVALQLVPGVNDPVNVRVARQQVADALTAFYWDKLTRGR